MSSPFSFAFQTFGVLESIAGQLMVKPAMNLVPVERGLHRRAALRYRLRLPVIFHWNDGREHTEGGFTADVALDGAYILSSHCPPVGSDVRIEVLIPTPDDSAGELRIECVGKVMRVVIEAESSGFGVRGTFDDDHLTRQVHR